MKKFVMFVALAVSIALVQSCGGAAGGKYGEARATMEKMIAETEKFSKAMDSVSDGKTAAAALNAWADSMDVFAKDMEALVAKYPELKDQTKLPEELKDLEEKSKALGEAIGPAMLKLSQFADDPDLQAAMLRLQTLGQ